MNIEIDNICEIYTTNENKLAFDILTNPLSYINGSAQLAAYHAIKIMSYISNNGKYEEYVSKLRLQYNFNQRTVP